MLLSQPLNHVIPLITYTPLTDSKQVHFVLLIAGAKMYAGHVAFCSVVSHDEYADRWTDGCQTITLCFPLDVADVITECIKYKLLALKYKVFIITRLPYLHNSSLLSFFAALVIHLLSFLLSSSSLLRMTCQSF